MNVKAKVKQVRETIEFKNFSKRELICTVDFDQRYPEDISIEFHKDNTELLNGISKGDIVLIDYYFRGNYYEPKDAYYTTVVGYNIQVSNKMKAKEPVIPDIPETDIDTPF